MECPSRCNFRRSKRGVAASDFDREVPISRGERVCEDPSVATFVTSDGVQIRYEIHGSGPAVLALHGGPSNVCDTLARDVEPLTDTFTLVFHDYRGSGRSAPASADTYRFERLADDLDELRAHLGLDTPALLAHSMGGFVALMYALRHPDHG